MEHKIKWDGSQEAFDEIQAQLEKLGDVVVTTSDKMTIEYTLDGKTKKVAKGKFFKYTVEEEEPGVVSLVNSKGEFVSRRTKTRRVKK